MHTMFHIYWITFIWKKGLDKSEKKNQDLKTKIENKKIYHKE